MPFFELARELFHDWSTSLARFDRVFIGGRAIDQIQQRLVGFYGIEGIGVHGGDGEDARGQIKVTPLVSRPLTPRERALIRLTVEEVNRRFAVDLKVDS